MPTQKDLVLEQINKGITENKQIEEAIMTAYQVKIPQSSIRRIKTQIRKAETIQEKSSSDNEPADDNSDSSVESVDVAQSDIDPSSEGSSGDTDSVSADISHDQGADDTRASQELDSIPSENMTVHVRQAEDTPEQELMAQQYRKRLRDASGQSKEEQIRKAKEELEKSQEIAEQEKIDADLLSDNVIDTSDLIVRSVDGTPLDNQERSKGRKHFSRILERRLPLFYKNGDIVNFGLWLANVVMKRVFRIKPKQQAKVVEQGSSDQQKEVTE